MAWYSKRVCVSLAVFCGSVTLICLAAFSRLEGETVAHRFPESSRNVFEGIGELEQSQDPAAFLRLVERTYEKAKQCGGSVTLEHTLEDSAKNMRKVLGKGAYIIDFDSVSGSFRMIGSTYEIESRQVRKFDIASSKGSTKVTFEKRTSSVSNVPIALSHLSQATFSSDFPLESFLLDQEIVEGLLEFANDVAVTKLDDSLVLTVTNDVQELLESDSKELLVRRFHINKSDYTLEEYEEIYPDLAHGISLSVKKDLRAVRCDFI